MKCFLSIRCFLIALFCVANLYSQENIVSNEIEADKAIDSAHTALNNLQLTKCLDYSEAILSYSLKNKKNGFTSKAYNLIGLCYEELKDLKKAENFYKKSIDYALQSKDNRILNLAHSTIANMYQYHEIDKNKAISNYEKAYEYALISKDSIDIIYSKIGLVQTYFDIDKMDIGYKHLIDFENYTKPLKDTQFNILLFTYKGYYYRKTNSFEMAEKNYLTVLSYIEAIDSEYDKTYAVDVYHEIYDFYKEYKKYELALEFLEKHDKIEDELNKKQIERQISTLGAPIEARVSNLKIQKIEAEKKLQDAKLLKTKLVNRIIIIVTILLLLIIVIISRYSFITKKINKKLKNTNEALELSMQKAEEANQVKSKFIATITHELRTPLYGVIGITNILGNDYKELKDSQHLKSLEFSAKYLLQLVNDVLIMSKIDDTEIQLNKSLFNLEKELETIINSLQLIAAKTSNELLFVPILPLPNLVVSDKIRLSQIIINLLSNSLKFTKNGKISLEVKLLKTEGEVDLIAFKVKDNGIGIPEELHEKVFDKFVQIERKEDDYQGTGLGLTIVKKLIQLFEGTIKLESQENVGTTITFCIPFEKMNQEVINNQKVNFIENFHNDLKVLVVEDNKINQVVTRKILESKNLNSVVVDDGYQAIELLKVNKFDLVLMDINMPKINGIETTKMIRSNGITIPIIAVTAFERDQISEDIYEVGFNDIISKPFDSNQLYEIIEKYITRI